MGIIVASPRRWTGHLAGGVFLGTFVASSSINGLVWPSAAVALLQALTALLGAAAMHAVSGSPCPGSRSVGALVSLLAAAATCGLTAAVGTAVLLVAFGASRNGPALASLYATSLGVLVVTPLVILLLSADLVRRRPSLRSVAVVFVIGASSAAVS